MYNKKTLPLAVLSSLLVVLMVADYEVLFFDIDKKQKDYGFLSSGVVDKMFGKVSQEKYSNIVSYNIFNLAGNDENIKKKEPRIDTGFILEVRGVTITRESRYALLWDKQDQKSIVVSEGDEIKNWQILSILNDRVAIGSADIIKEIFVNAMSRDEQQK